MKPSLRAAGLVALGAALAAAGIYGWQRWFSRDAEVRAIHAACTREFADASARMKSGMAADHRGAGDSVRKRAAEAFGRWVDGATGGMSDAVCGTIRDACTIDFDGSVCSAARERYR